MQQYLPFTVLKRLVVITTPSTTRVATVLTVYGIETELERGYNLYIDSVVATVLTVYGIETNQILWHTH